MKALPIGVPKVMVSTLASGNTRPFVGGSDITMIYPLADISGLNALLVQILDNAAPAISGMVTNERASFPRAKRGIIGATQFGVTTPCVDAARKILEHEGFEVVAFHAAGAGGQSFESLAKDGSFVGVLDIIRCNLRTVNNVLARETGNVRARSTDVFAVDRCDTLSLLGKGSGSDRCACATAEDQKIIFFGIHLR